MPVSSTKQKSVRKLYDEIGRRYSENKSLSVSMYTEMPAILSLAGDVRGLRVLDVGCGPGRHACALLERGARVTGIDVSEEMLKAARERCGGRGNFLRADFERAKFPRASFDVVTASLCLMYSRDLRPAFKNFRAWLKAGGRLIFSIYHPVRFFQKIPDFDFSRRQKVWIHLEGCDVTVWNYYHPLGDYFDALLGSGFELLRFVEPVLSRRRKGWQDDHYRIPRTIVFEARKKR
ncbi:MAG TPA: class I SAM-dependent methyltransferase [Pyrinomonadaceae bacterium]|nr:class I SAM-dependent methyltransferase [Pyrinomonadaceae bacterium]